MRQIKFRAWSGSRMLFMGKGGDCDFELSGGEIYECGFFDFSKKDYYLMQYTGLNDNKHKGIYEGDIVYIAGLGNKEMVFPFIELYEAYPENDIGYIVGNIYQNPELIAFDK